MYNIALEILLKIESFGYKAFLVGGYPRDRYLHLESFDIDICTSAKPEELSKIFQNIPLKNQGYGSIILFYKQLFFEITTFREEKTYQNHRFPIIQYVDDLLLDLKRRDFIINTLCIDSKGNFIDLLGAKRDLENRVVRVVGDVEKKLKEDSLRMLRAIRFATTLNFTLDLEIFQVILKHRDLIRSLSYFRKKQELDKIFSSSYVAYGLELLKNCDLFDVLEIFPKEKIVVTELIGIYSQLSMSSHYPFSKKERKDMKKIQDLMKLDLFSPIVLYRYDLFLCLIVADIKKIDRSYVLKAYNNLPIHKRSDLAISTSEICLIYQKKAGFYLKDVFEILEQNILNGQLKNEKEEIKLFLKHTL